MKKSMLRLVVTASAFVLNDCFAEIHERENLSHVIGHLLARGTPAGACDVSIGNKSLSVND